MKRTAYAHWMAMSALFAALVLLCGNAVAEGDTAAAENAQPSEMNQDVRDAWLDGKLETALLFNRHLNSFDINTDVENGKAYLSGAVESEVDKDLAVEVAKSIEGIGEVEDNLTVDREAAASARESEAYQEKSEWRQGIENATLTAKVKSKLLFNENTSGMAINVDSNNGVVTLSGTVESEEEAALAVQIAKNVTETREVQNRLEIVQETG